MTEELDTTAAVMAQYLVDSGISQFFGYPGSSNIEFMEAARRRGVTTVLARQESSAAFMAEGFAMATGVPGVCLSTLGPGSVGLVGGVAAATLDRVPVIAISGQIATSREPYFTHQVIDHNRVFSPISKWATRVEPASVSTVMRKALRVATAERPGAVHLTTNSDVAVAAPGDTEIVLPPTRPAMTGMQVFSEPGRDPVATLRRAERPVLLAGIAAMRADAGAELVALSEQTGMPVVVAPMAKGVFGEDHPHFAGVLDMACNDLVWDLLGRADLIVAAGFDAVELIKPWQVDAPVLHIDAVPNTDQIYRADIELVGHIGSILGWLGESASTSRWTAAEIRAHQDELARQLRSGRIDGKLNPTDVVDTLRAAFPEDTVVTTDVGSHKLLVGQGWTTYAPRTSLMTNGLSSMGFSVPAAIGAKLARPEAPVVCTVGDGGLAMVAGELQVAATLGLGIVFVVFCDQSLNRIELKQKKLGYPSTATRIDASDLVGLANSMGCDGERVGDVPRLEKVLADLGTSGRAGSLERPLLIEARIDPAQYEFQF